MIFSPSRRIAAEFLGSLLLVAVVVGSGIQATTLTSDVGLQLLANTLATVFGLFVLISVFGPVSGAHFNPVVTAADWFLLKRTRLGGQLPQGPDLSLKLAAFYVAAQIAGAVTGAVLANLIFGLDPVSISHTDRSSSSLFLSEIVATGCLVFVIFALISLRKTAVVPLAVATYVGAAYWFTSSTSFANPAVTLGRIFSDSFAGIDPASAPGFLAAQIIGAVGAVALVLWFFGRKSIVLEGDGH